MKEDVFKLIKKYPIIIPGCIVVLLAIATATTAILINQNNKNVEAERILADNNESLVDSNQDGQENIDYKNKKTAEVENNSLEENGTPEEDNMQPLNQEEINEPEIEICEFKQRLGDISLLDAILSDNAMNGKVSGSMIPAFKLIYAVAFGESINTKYDTSDDLLRSLQNIIQNSTGTEIADKIMNYCGNDTMDCFDQNIYHFVKEPYEYVPDAIKQFNYFKAHPDAFVANFNTCIKPFFDLYQECY